MSNPTSSAAADNLSLTLPDWRTALKRRVRRPKLPDKNTVMYLFFVALYGLFAVAAFATGRDFFGAIDAVLCGSWWGLMQARKRNPVACGRYADIVLVFSIVNIAASLITG